MYRIVGCQDLLSDTPSLAKKSRDSSTLSPMDSKTLDRRPKTSRSISRYDFKTDIAGIATGYGLCSLLLVHCDKVQRAVKWLYVCVIVRISVCYTGGVLKYFSVPALSYCQQIST